jgi:hypothetical protein
MAVQSKAILLFLNVSRALHFEKGAQARMFIPINHANKFAGVLLQRLKFKQKYILRAHPFIGARKLGIR